MYMHQILVYKHNYDKRGTSSCQKTFFLVNSVYMFSVLVFMCRDPGDTTSKISKKK